MILQALADYYERKRAIDPAAVAPPGWEYREIAFFIDVADDGSASLVDRRSAARKRGELLLVPTAEIRSGNDAWKKPNLLWDHMGFVLGQQKRQTDGAPDPSDKPEKVANQHAAFRARIAALAQAHATSEGLRAIERFYAKTDFSTIEPAELREALFSGQGLNVTFRRRGQIDPVCQESWVIDECSFHTATDDDSDQNVVGQCLLTGKTTGLARLHPKVSYVTTKPAPFVAANTNEAPAYSSYGKEQAFNAPVSVEAASRYSLALNALTGRDSRNKVRIGDAVTLIWADRDDGIDAELAGMFGDNPDAHIDAIKDRLVGVAKGTLGFDVSGVRFFVLGLSPNASRVAVRFWLHERFDTLGARVLRHFHDLRIARSDKAASTPSLRALLKAIAVQGDEKNIPPRLAGEWMRSVLEGVAYPPALLNAAVSRCRGMGQADR